MKSASFFVSARVPSFVSTFLDPEKKILPIGPKNVTLKIATLKIFPLFILPNLILKSNLRGEI